MWRILLDAHGTLGRKALNKRIAKETGDRRPFFEDEESFERAISEGFVEYEEGHTIVRTEGIRW